MDFISSFKCQLACCFFVFFFICTVFVVWFFNFFPWTILAVGKVLRGVACELLTWLQCVETERIGFNWIGFNPSQGLQFLNRIVIFEENSSNCKLLQHFLVHLHWLYAVVATFVHKCWNAPQYVYTDAERIARFLIGENRMSPICHTWQSSVSQILCYH